MHVRTNLVPSAKLTFPLRLFEFLGILFAPISTILCGESRLTGEPLSAILTSFFKIRNSPLSMIGGDSGFVLEVPPAELSATAFTILSQPLLLTPAKPFFQRASSIGDQGH